MCDACMDDLKVKHLGLSYKDPRHFLQFEWGWPVAYMRWRAFWAVYQTCLVSVSVIMTSEEKHGKEKQSKWYIYLTNWTTAALAIATVIDFVVVVYINMSEEDILKGKTVNLTWYHKIVWVLFNIANCSTILVTILYWTLEYKAGTRIKEMVVGTRILNCIYVLLNLSVTAMPVRIYHAIHTMVYFLVYFIFTIIYDHFNGTNVKGEPYIYRELNWKKDTAMAYSYCFLVVSLMVPAVQIFLFFVYSRRRAYFDAALQRETKHRDGTLLYSE